MSVEEFSIPTDRLYVGWGWKLLFISADLATHCVCQLRHFLLLCLFVFVPGVTTCETPGEILVSRTLELRERRRHHDEAGFGDIDDSRRSARAWIAQGTSTRNRPPLPPNWGDV